MQNYEQILLELGIEVPEDKKAGLKKKMDENYRTKADYDKAVEKRDEYKASLEDVQGKPDGFKDVDVADLKGQIATLTKQLNDEKTARAQDAQRVETEKNVNAFLSSVDEDGNKKYEFINGITEDFYRGKVRDHPIRQYSVSAQFPLAALAVMPVQMSRTQSRSAGVEMESREHLMLKQENLQQVKLLERHSAIKEGAWIVYALTTVPKRLR